jgi:peptidoglycan/xylan/chitin deacetylase (PgdA/CDA1 family)
MSATPGVTKPSAAKFIVRIIKLGVSILWFAVLSAGRFLRMGSNLGSAVILYYHSVPESYAGRFEKQMRTVATLTLPIDLNAIHHLGPGTHSIAITFDDGLDSFVEHAIPVLHRWKIPATIFVVADALDTKPSWGESYYAHDERIMSENELRTLPASISVGSHTLTHPNLVTQTEETACREIVESRKKLESLLDCPVATFSFPHGEFNDSLVCQCRAAGYQKIFTTEPELIRSSGSEFVFGRVAADPWDWDLEFKMKILGAYCWQSRLRVVRKKIRSLFSSSGARHISNNNDALKARANAQALND